MKRALSEKLSRDRNAKEGEQEGNDHWLVTVGRSRVKLAQKDGQLTTLPTAACSSDNTRGASHGAAAYTMHAQSGWTTTGIRF